jgi:hypothetical protein
VALEAMIICAAKVNGKGLPANGSQLNVTSFAQSALAASGKAITITSAQITRESADTSNGNAVYLSNISGSYTNANNQAASFSLSFKHIPQNEDNTKYAGLLTYITNANANDPNMANMKDVVSVLYGKNGSSLSYRMRLATFCQSTDTSVYFNAQGEVTEISNSTFGDQTSCTGVAKNGWTGGFNESIAQIDITTGVGKLAFGWQAGQGDGFLRTMNVETRADGSGDAFFGFTRNEKNADNTSSLRAEGDLLIDGMICNWSGPFGNHNPDVNSLVQMQVLTKNAQGVWIPTSSMINFAPTNSCSALQGSDTQPFKFGVDKAEYDSRMGPFTNNLATIATHYNFSMPAVPSLPK